MSRPTWRNTSFNASHLIRPGQLHHRYCLSRDWPLISQHVHSPTPHLSFGTVCLQKSCCAIRNIVLKDILRHSCLTTVTRPSDRYHTSASAAFCRHTWRFINLLIIIIIIIIIITPTSPFTGHRVKNLSSVSVENISIQSHPVMYCLMDAFCKRNIMHENAWTLRTILMVFSRAVCRFYSERVILSVKYSAWEIGWDCEAERVDEGRTGTMKCLLPRDVMLSCGVCPSLFLSVYPSVTFVYCVETRKHILKLLFALALQPFYYFCIGTHTRPTQRRNFEWVTLSDLECTWVT